VVERLGSQVAREGELALAEGVEPHVQIGGGPDRVEHVGSRGQRVVEDLEREAREVEDAALPRSLSALDASDVVDGCARHEGRVELAHVPAVVGGGD